MGHRSRSSYFKKYVIVLQPFCVSVLLLLPLETPPHSISCPQWNWPQMSMCTTTRKVQFSFFPEEDSRVHTKLGIHQGKQTNPSDQLGVIHLLNDYYLLFWSLHMLNCLTQVLSKKHLGEGRVVFWGWSGAHYLVQDSLNISDFLLLFVNAGVTGRSQILALEQSFL